MGPAFFNVLRGDFMPPSFEVSLSGLVAFNCPGCGEAHQIFIGAGPGPRWEYNDNPIAPTFTPSILITGSRPITEDQWSFMQAGGQVIPEQSVCHSFITDGQIQFLADCTHALAGRTVPLPPIN